MGTKVKKPWAILKVFVEDKHTLVENKEKDLYWQGLYKRWVKNSQLQGEIIVTNKMVIIDGEKHGGKSNFLHEIIHFILDVTHGQHRRHTKRFYRICDFLKKELAK